MRFNMLAAAMGHVLQSEDVYASFGVHNAVISSSDLSQHEQEMLALDVSARDGDDSIDLNNTEEAEEPGEELEEPDEQEEEHGETEELPDTGDDFVPLGDPSEELKQASESLNEYATGFQEMRAQAIKAGLPEEVAGRIEAEYEEDGKLSDDSYMQLEKAGYSRGFVNSFMQGQEALAESFVTKVMDFAGGRDKFNQVLEHMKANSPDAADMLYAAIERQDLVAIKTTINLGMSSRAKKFGKSPERTVTKRAEAPARTTNGPEGYSSQAEMVKDMSSTKYRDDAVFRAQVEARVMASSW
ncbi:capsid assembly protein [Pseudomonas asplenii]|uniref:capsid assembly protein n=1 Tax=Pseudomonas asplenii TaxID=53407 RepID=UPI0006CDA20A|nr:hypothetical protein [Pseudomonas fuscovaginae]KPA96907.1 Phage T7 capsid assembly protein [Pseudomonas fuscovaginae]